MALSLSIPFLSSFTAAGEQAGQKPGTVLIIGAGAAGLTAAYALKKRGVDSRILEASSNFGGRVKRAGQFADFPIDLGAEWIHTHPSVLSDIIADPSQQPEQEAMEYTPKNIQFLKKGRLRSRNFVRYFYSEWKFKHTTWYGFLERYLLPDIADRILYKRPVVSINYSAEQVKVGTINGEYFQADKVLITRHYEHQLLQV
ncbi:MAG: NAD(P)-binding protein [Bacteroidetes bacterium]|nr:NAD(P)-binding protein [Bacteroidota bacterium]